jgi:hypothetical protein
MYNLGRSTALIVADATAGGFADVAVIDDITCDVEVLSEECEFRVGQSTRRTREPFITSQSSVLPHLEMFHPLVLFLPLIGLNLFL